MADLLDKDFNNSLKNIHRTKGRCGESKKKKKICKHIRYIIKKLENIDENQKKLWR